VHPVAFTILLYVVYLPCLAVAENAQESAIYIAQAQTRDLLPININSQSVRKAVKQALSQYKGTVLSVEEKNGRYVIKILSEGGTIKMISVANDNKAKPVHNQPPVTHSLENGTSK